MIKNIIEVLEDIYDTKCSFVILMDDLEELTVLTQSIISCDRHRFIYELYKDEITKYMMEISMPYNRYIALMDQLRKRGWTLKQETKVDIFNRMIKV